MLGKLDINTADTDIVVVVNEDTTPLIPREAKRSWWSRLASGVVNHTVRPVYRGVRHAVTHPISTITSTLTALPTAIYAFLDATNTRPVEISAQWWADMLTGSKI